ncbi:hypothetical protein BC940DRAFT_151765 [Gongronella butleri]|nr:hypothetical protein BC940DRAFT_151765 [Gongronella butleri]
MPHCKFFFLFFFIHPLGSFLLFSSFLHSCPFLPLSFSPFSPSFPQFFLRPSIVMGNTESHPTYVSEEVVSNLPKRTQQRLSRPPSIKSAHTTLTTTRVPKKKPPQPGFGYFEAAAVARPPAPRKKVVQPRQRRGSTTTSTTTSSNKSGQTEKSTPVSAKTSPSLLVSQHDLQPLDLQFSTFNDRRYLANPGFHFHTPCDDEETERLVILHFLLKYVLKGNVAVPIESMTLKQPGTQMLDIACGCGTWVLEMAADYPEADVYGIDLLPNFPTSVKPSNAHFCQHNYISSLPFPDNSLDYVHVRLMLGLLTNTQMQRLLGEIARILKPAGTVEIVDVDYRVQHPGPLTQALVNEQLYSVFQQRHIDWQQCHHLSTVLMTQPSKHGFIDIHQDTSSIPLGWGGQVGQVHGQCFEGFLNAIRPALRESVQCPGTWNPTTMEAHMGLTPSLIQKIIKECVQCQSHLNWYVCYAQKSMVPLAAASPSLATHSTASKSSTFVPSISSSLENIVPNKARAMLPSANQAGPLPAKTTMPPPNWETIDSFIYGYTD